MNSRDIHLIVNIYGLHEGMRTDDKEIIRNNKDHKFSILLDKGLIIERGKSTIEIKQFEAAICATNISKALDSTTFYIDKTKYTLADEQALGSITEVCDVLTTATSKKLLFELDGVKVKVTNATANAVVQLGLSSGLADILGVESPVKIPKANPIKGKALPRISAYVEHLALFSDDVEIGLYYNAPKRFIDLFSIAGMRFGQFGRISGSGQKVRLEPQKKNVRKTFIMNNKEYNVVQKLDFTFIDSQGRDVNFGASLVLYITITNASWDR